MSRFKVLSTKKLDPALLKSLKDGIEITEQEFIAIKPIEENATEERVAGFAKQAKLTVAFTSRHAVEAVEKYLQKDALYIDWNIFCLSGATKQAIEAIPVLKNNVSGEAGNASALAEAIIRKNIKDIVFFCGNKRRDDLPVMLAQADIRVQEVKVYETLETPVITSGDFDGILFFSPSGVQSFFSVNQLSARTVCFAIGSTTAETIAGFTKNEIIISDSPVQEAIISSVQHYFKNIKSYE